MSDANRPPTDFDGPESLGYQLSKQAENPAKIRRAELTVKFTESFLGKLKYRPDGLNTYNHANFPGLSCHVSKRSQVTFKLRLRIDGVRRTAVFDPYHPKLFNLESAELAAACQRDAWRKGQSKAGKTPTLAELVEQYEEAKVRGDRTVGRKGLPVNWEKNIKEFTKIYKPLLPMPVDKLRLKHLHDAEDAYLTRREKDTGKRPESMIRSTVASVTKPMLRYAMVQHWFPIEDFNGIKAGTTEEGIRFLLPRELQLTFPAADQLPHLSGLFFRFLLAIGCRLTTAVKMQWRDLRIERVMHGEMMVWRVPQARMVKGDRAIFPVVGESRRIIDELRKLWVASAGKDDASQTVFPPSILTKWDGNRDSTTKKVFALSGTRDWHRHDLRRTHATYLGYAGARKGIVALSLNHASGKELRDVTDRYMRSTTYLELAEAHLVMHQLMKDIEAGVESDGVQHVQSELVFNNDAQEFCDELKMDWDLARIKVEQKEE